MYLVVGLGVYIYDCRMQDVIVHPNIKSLLLQPYIFIYEYLWLEYVKQGLII
jgi:hypothetical protein